MEFNYTPAFVGRQGELGLLQQKLDAMLNSTGSTVFIAGESGVGKTRLVDEFLSHAAQHNCQCLRAQCLPEHVMPFAPIIAMLTEANLEHLILEDKPPKLEALYAVTRGGILVAKYERRESIDTDIFMGMLTAVKTFITDALSQIKQGVVSEDVQVLVHGTFSIVNVPGRALNLVALTTGRENEYLITDMRAIIQKFENEHGLDERWHENETKVRAIETEITELFNTGKYEGIDYTDDPKIRQGNILENVLRAIQRKSDTQPVILFIDDLQWTDASSLALIHYLARNTRRQRVLIIGTYRSEELGGALKDALEIMNREGILESIELKRFDMAQCTALVSSVLGSEVEQEFVEEIYAQSEGNALFVLEVLKQLYAENALWYENGKWRYRSDVAKIPVRVQDVILRRIRKLGREERELLDAASVIGEVFTSEILANITESTRMRVLKMLANIEREHHVVVSLKDRYRFEHAKIREVLYAELPEELRVTYHDAIANELEEAYRKGNRACLGEMVLHYWHAGNNAKVIEYGLTAGKLAQKKYANDEALKIYKAVLSALGETYSEIKVQICYAIVDVLELDGRYDEALSYINEVIAQTNGVGRARAHRRCAEIYINKGDYTQAMEEVKKGIELAKDSRVELARLNSLEGLIYERKGDYDLAIKCQEKALTHFEDEKDIANVYIRTGGCFWYRGEYDKALEYFHKSLEINERIGNLKGIAGSYNNIGVVYYEKGEYAVALEYLQKALKLRERMGDVQGIAASYNNTGIIYMDMGAYSKALDFLKKGLDLQERIGDLEGSAGTCNNIGIVYKEIGAYDSALESHMKGLKIREKIGDVEGVATSNNNIGNVYFEKGDLEKALSFFQNSLMLNEKIGDAHGAAEAYGNIAHVHFEKGDFDRALEYAQKCLSISQKIGNTLIFANSLISSAEILLELGRTDASRENLEKGIALAQKHSMKSLVADALRIYGKLYMAVGDRVEALDCFARAIEIFEQIKKRDNSYYRTYYEYGKAREDPAMLKNALAWFEHTGNAHWVMRIKKCLEQMDTKV